MMSAKTILVAFAMMLPMTIAQADSPSDAIGDGVKDLPIFDAHVHYKAESWHGLSPKIAIELMDRNGVVMALVSSDPDEGTIKLFEYAPSRIIPEVSPYHGAVGQTTWTDTSGILDYMAARMDTYPHEGIGEFHIHNIDRVETKFIAQLAGMASERKAFLHIHADYQVVDAFYAQQPGLKIIWAHAGLVDPPDVVSRTMDKYPNLFADLSYREHEILDHEKGFDPAWRALLLRHSDRFMVGSDTWNNDQWVNYAGLIEKNRRWLAYLPRPVAEAIAYKNAERAFGRKMSKDLIGKR